MFSASHLALPLLVLAALLGGCAGSGSAADPGDLSFQNLVGQSIPPAAFADKVIVIDFWATWCGPCLESMPEFQEASSSSRTTRRCSF